MKQMSLIEMDGFLKGKCIPSDLKVNETNAEYLVRKFGELESKLETALRECRSAGITIDNLEAKCAALAADNKKAMEAMRQADAAVKLAHEKFSALTAENAGMKSVIEYCINPDNQPEYHDQGMGCGVEDHGYQRDGYSACYYGWESAMERVYSEVIPDAIPETPATDAFLAEVRAHDLNAFIRHHSAELDAHIKNGGEQFDEKSVRIRDIIVSARLFREQIRKEAAQ
ncbi:TPA: hNH endonuclease [Escherichia coli]|nr:hNH endonuclease [Escherichia coli]HDX3171147.1 hNH endonuclease [Escherichia coli]HEA3476729.1 hNH endonuclease [Escherichia coli]